MKKWLSAGWRNIHFTWWFYIRPVLKMKIRVIAWGINPWHINWKWAFKHWPSVKNYGWQIQINLILFMIYLEV